MALGCMVMSDLLRLLKEFALIAAQPMNWSSPMPKGMFVDIPFKALQLVKVKFFYARYSKIVMTVVRAILLNNSTFKVKFDGK
jgi:hypothetical protein